MLKRIRAIASAAAFVAVGLVAGAQAKPAPTATTNDLHWFVGVGVAKPMSDLDARSEIGFNALGGAEYTAKPGVGLRGELSVQSFGGRGAGFGTTTEFGVLASGVYHPTIPSLPAMWKPYALAGIGFYSGNFSKVGGGTSSTGFGFGLGGGTDVLIGGFDLFGEIRYIGVSQSGGTFGWIPLTVGIRF